MNCCWLSIPIITRILDHYCEPYDPLDYVQTAQHEGDVVLGGTYSTRSLYTSDLCETSGPKDRVESAIGT